jgi:hypothetical protein
MIQQTLHSPAQRQCLHLNSTLCPAINNVYLKRQIQIKGFDFAGILSCSIFNP